MDLISRQAAIDAIEPTLKSILQGNSFKAINVMDKIRELPSAQSEIVMCKDCKHRDAEDGFCEGRGWPMQLVPDDGFCDKGERSEE